MYDVYDKFGNQTWHRDENGYLTNQTFDITNGKMLEQIQDVSTSIVSAPNSWTTPSGGGLHLVTDNLYDDLGRLTQILGPSHTGDLSGSLTTLRSATWNAYVEGSTADQVNTAVGYATGTSPSYTYTILGPVQIAIYNKAGQTTSNVVAQQPSSTTGPLTTATTFAQSTWQRWTNFGYDQLGQKINKNLYRLIPSTGAGTSGTNFDESQFGYDSMGELVRQVSQTGTILRTVFDWKHRTISDWIGTTDVPTGSTCWCDWSPTNTSGTNMAEVKDYQYDGNDSCGDDTLTQKDFFVTPTSFGPTSTRMISATGIL